MEGGRYSLSVDDDRSVLDERQILHLVLAPQEGSSVIDHLQHLGRVLQEQPHLSPLPLPLCCTAGFSPRARDAVALFLRFRGGPHQRSLTNASRVVADKDALVRRIRFHFVDRGHGPPNVTRSPGKLSGESK